MLANQLANGCTLGVNHFEMANELHTRATRRPESRDSQAHILAHAAGVESESARSQAGSNLQVNDRHQYPYQPPDIEAAIRLAENSPSSRGFGQPTAARQPTRSRATTGSRREHPIASSTGSGSPRHGRLPTGRGSQDERPDAAPARYQNAESRGDGNFAILDVCGGRRSKVGCSTARTPRRLTRFRSRPRAHIGDTRVDRHDDGGVDGDGRFAHAAPPRDAGCRSTRPTGSEWRQGTGLPF